jgi:MFS family permease
MQYSAIGCVALGIGIGMYLLKKHGRGLTVMFLIAGGSLSPVIGPWVGSSLASLGGMIAGISLATVLAALSGYWVFSQLKNKDKHPKTCWVAFMLPVLLVSSGLPLFVKVSNLIDQVGNQANTAVTRTK